MTTALPQSISTNDLQRGDVPSAAAEWPAIWKFALTFDGYKEHGSFEACAAIANDRRHGTLSDLRTCLFFEQRRWRHFGDDPDEDAERYVRSLVQRIHDALPAGPMRGTSDAAMETKRTQMVDSFSPDIVANLKTYFYRLIDPRNGETFYVGKGKGNRVFSHIKAKTDLDGDEIDNKLKRIREIRLAGFEVGHVIHRHGMDEKTAFEVESALIDAYPGLTNIVAGAGGNDYGAMHAEEIFRRYSADEAVFKHKALLISVNRSAAERSLYDATRYAWKIDIRKAKKAEVILATMHGLIVGAFMAHKWLPATADNFPGRAEGDGVPGRFGFVGAEARDEIKRLYIGKRVPDAFRKRGAANPIKYTWGRAAGQDDTTDGAARHRR